MSLNIKYIDKMLINNKHVIIKSVNFFKLFFSI